MVAEVEEETAPVLIVKVAVVLPAVTVTLAGTVAAELLLERVTARFVAAAALSVTVPVEVVPPLTDTGLTVTETSEAADVTPSEVNARL